MEYTNSDLKPTEIADEPFLYERNEEIMEEFDEFDRGKWMMFFPKSKLDEKWAEARRLYKYY